MKKQVRIDQHQHVVNLDHVHSNMYGHSVITPYKSNLAVSATASTISDMYDEQLDRLREWHGLQWLAIFVVALYAVLKGLQA